MRGFVYKRTTTNKRQGKTTVSYYAVVETTQPGQAQRKKDWGTAFSTKKEAEAALTQRVAAFQSRTYVTNTRITLRDYVEEMWLPTLKDRLKPTTLNSYERALRGYVIPRIGGMKLQDLSPGRLNLLYSELRESGGTQRSAQHQGEIKGLSQKSVRNTHAILSKALNDAIDLGLLVNNPASRAKPPRQRSVSEKIEAWDTDELRAFLHFASNDRVYACWHLAAYTGMRRGELLGLRWEDIDFAAVRLAIRQTLVLEYTTPTFSTPKSHDARVVDLDPDTLTVLREHRRRQLEELTAWGDGYDNSGLVFRREDGRFMSPDGVSQRFDRLVARSGIRRIKFHGLRHTHATLMLKANIPVKVVSERLGHADPAFTLRVYQHVLSGMQAQAAELFAETLRPE